MAKWSNDSGLDAALSWYANSNIIHLCKSQPANFAALATESLGSIALTPGVGNGDFTLADGNVSGRKLTVAAQDIAAATASDAGATLHAAIASTGDSTLRYVTTVPQQAITTGNPIQIGTWEIELRDPTA